MAEVVYPVDLPLDCAKEVIRIVTAGTIVEEKDRFALCVWNVQGYIQKVLLGEPVPHAVPEFVELRAVLAKPRAGEIPSWLLVLIEMLLKLLEEWLT